MAPQLSIRGRSERAQLAGPQLGILERIAGTGASGRQPSGSQIFERLGQVEVPVEVPYDPNQPPPIPLPEIDMQESLAGKLYAEPGKTVGLGIAPALPYVGAAIGGIAALGGGGLPGIAAGGTIGKGLEIGIDAYYGGERYGPEAIPTPYSRAGTLGEMGWEGGVQAGSEALFRTGIGAGALALRTARRWTAPHMAKLAGWVTGRGSRAVPKTAAQLIKEAPETVGQFMGTESTWGNLINTIERYSETSFFGTPLRKIRATQQKMSRMVMATLSTVRGAPVPTRTSKLLAENWRAAREAVQGIASPMYQQIETVPMPGLREVAKNLLKSYDNEITGQARKVLRQIAGIDKVPNKKILIAHYQHPIIRKIYAEAGIGIEDLQTLTAGTGKEALVARKLLNRLSADLYRSGHRAESREIRMALGELDSFVESQLDDTLIAVKKNADKLWQRSYTMERVYDSLKSMVRTQVTDKPPTLNPKEFLGLVSDLTEQPKIGGRTLMMGLFDTPAEREALIDLSNYLGARDSAGAGLDMAIAHIGTALAALSVPAGIATGVVTGKVFESPKAGAAIAAAPAASLTSMYLLSVLLSKGGGARALHGYLKAPTVKAASTLIRFAFLPEAREQIPQLAETGAEGAYGLAEPVYNQLFVPDSVIGDADTAPTSIPPPDLAPPPNLN
jgi:hypothetical protein